MKVSLSLVPWLTVLVVVSIARAAIISRGARRTTELDPASAGEGPEDQTRRESGRSPTHRRHHHRHHEHLHRGGGHHSGGCPGCRQWQELSRTSEEELIQLRIEKIKQDLLNRLGLSAPPNVTSNSINRIPENIPAPLVQQLNNDDSDSPPSGRRPPFLNDEDGQDEMIEGHSKQIIVFAEEAAFLHKHRHTNLPSSIIHFTLPSELHIHTVLSVELWLYKNSNTNDEPNCSANTTQTISIHSLPTSNVSSPQHPLTNRTSPEFLASSQDVPPHAGWFRMDFLSAVQSWLADPRTDPRGLGVEHSQCVSLGTDQSHRPFLTIGTRGTNARRRKRNAQQCHDGSQNCCRTHPLYIDFKELGWNFILSPAGYTANYCHGPCSVPSFENLMNTERRHSSILQKVSRLRNNPDVLPCCSPTSLSSLSLIYNDGKGMTIHQDLDNMRVDSCGCS